MGALPRFDLIVLELERGYQQQSPRQIRFRNAMGGSELGERRWREAGLRRFRREEERGVEDGAAVTQLGQQCPRVTL